jgi:hypothetical protein
MIGRFGQGELLAGGAAAALLLLLVFAFDLNPLLAILLAVMTYGGTALLRAQNVAPTDETIDESHSRQRAYETAIDHLGSIRKQESQIANEAVRIQVGRIADMSDRILVAMWEDQNLTAAPLFDSQLLAPFDALLTQYVRLSNRGVRSADEVLRKAESHDLPMIERAAEVFYEKLHRANMVDMATLGDVLELNLESISTLPLRRSVS